MSADIRVLKTFEDQTNEETIEMLRKFLSDAMCGRIVAVAVAAIAKDGSSITMSTSSKQIQSLIGAVAVLQYRMIEECTSHEVD